MFPSGGDPQGENPCTPPRCSPHGIKPHLAMCQMRNQRFLQNNDTPVGKLRARPLGDRCVLHPPFETKHGHYYDHCLISTSQPFNRYNLFKGSLARSIPVAESVAHRVHAGFTDNPPFWGATEATAREDPSL